MSRFKSTRPLLGLLLLAGVAFPAAVPRSARADVSLRISPAIIELAAEPGGKGSQPLTIGNGGTDPVDIAAAVEPYKGADGERSAVDWLNVEPAEFRLEPGEERAVDVDIDVPRGLKSGGRYALVTFTTGVGTAAGNGAAIAGKLGAAFLVTVKGKGKLERAVGLEHFAPFLEPDGRIGFRALLRNDGNIHVRPAGAVAVADEAGKPLAALDLEGPTSLLPGDEALLAGHGSLPLPTATYRADALVDYGGEKPLTATIEFEPHAAFTVTEITVCENLDRGPTVDLTLRNDGDLGLLPAIRLDLRSVDGQAAPQPSPAPPVVLWPHETATVTGEFGERLLSGEYVLTVRADYAAPAEDGQTVLPPVEKEAPFRIGGLGEGAVPLCTEKPEA